MENKERLYLTVIWHDSQDVLIKRLGCRGAEYYPINHGMKRLGELVNFGFGIYLTIYFTNGETEKDYYLPDESTTRDIKRSLNDLGINSISFEIANKKQKDGSCVFLAGFYHWRDEGMIGWQPSSKTSFNDQMLKDRKLKVDSFKHQSMYTEYGLTPKQY